MRRGRRQLALGGSTALVTGASSGIGAAIAAELADAGTQLWLVGRDHAGLNEVAAATGGQPIRVDLARPDGPAAVVHALGERARDVGVLVHCAGRGWAGPVAQMDAATLSEVLAVDLVAPVELTRLLLPGLLVRGGALVFLSSIAGVVGVADEAVYSAAKAGLRAFADSLRLELGADGPSVSVVFPGAVATPFFDRRGRPYDRSRPRQVSPQTVAATTVSAIRTGRAEVFVPGWLNIAARVRGAAPATYRRLAGRWG